MHGKKLSKAIKKANINIRGRRCTVNSEYYNTPFGHSTSFFAIKNKYDHYELEQCECGADSPELCECDPIFPPTPRNPLKPLPNNEFKDPKPFLMYTIYKENHPDCDFIFLAKKEGDAFDEVQRLNAKKRLANLWVYREEKQYNKAAIADYVSFLNNTNNYVKNT